MRLGLLARSGLSVNVGCNVEAPIREQLRLLREAIEKPNNDGQILLMLEHIRNEDFLYDRFLPSILHLAITFKCSDEVICALLKKNQLPKYETFVLCIHYQIPVGVVKSLLNAGMPIYPECGAVLKSPLEFAKEYGADPEILNLIAGRMDRDLLRSVRDGALEARVQQLLTYGARVKRLGFFLEGEKKLVHFALNAGYSDATLKGLIDAGGTVCLISDVNHPGLQPSTKALLSKINAVRSFTISGDTDSDSDSGLLDDDRAHCVVE